MLLDFRKSYNLCMYASLIMEKEMETSNNKPALPPSGQHILLQDEIYIQYWIL